jgi:hypothetical protein
MDGDEILINIASAGIALIFWYRWMARALDMAEPLPFGHWGATRYLTKLGYLSLCILGCAGLHVEILVKLSAQEVRSDAQYVFLFTAVWGVALAGATVWGNVLGVRALEDGIERGNPGTVWATTGVWLGATLCSAGANIGEGPTIYTTLFPMSLALGAWAGLWLVFAMLTRIGQSISVERDPATGIRLAGLLIAWGLVLGRAVAGDWESIRATIFDFKMQGWPSLVLLVIAIFLEFRLRPSRKNLSPSVPKAGIVPAFIYVLAASLWFARLGLIH